MASVRIISANGRLKNKIDFSYEVSTRYPDFITESGMIYTTDPAMLTGIITLQFGYGATGIISTTFTGIPNGTYYVKAYAYDDTSVVTVYSAVQTVFVTDKGYEIATTGLTIASPLVIAEGTEGVEKVLTSDSSGLSKWKPIKSLFTFGHYIGELYGGGIVVDVWKEAEDEKVLIASLEDISFDYYTDSPDGGSYETKSQVEWSTGIAATTAVGPGAQSLYNGRQNTDAIIAQSIELGTVYNRNGYAGSAAQVCAEYRGGGYEDWYLPAYYEVNAIYNQAAILNKVLGSDNVYSKMTTGEGEWITSIYWSSTEAIVSAGSSTYAYMSELGNMAPIRKDNLRVFYKPKIRAVRKESVYTGDGLCLALDTTNIKSFDDIRYSSGLENRWVDLVNGGLTSSYSFSLSAFPTVASGGTLGYILTDLTTGNNIESLLYRKVGNWGFTKINGTVTPTLYNNTGESSLVSDYFTVTNQYSYLQFETIDQSTVKSSVSATVNVYVSIDSGTPGTYNLIRQITNTVGDNNNASGGSPIVIQLGTFIGKNISIKITAPNASYVNSGNRFGPSVDNLYVRYNSGGYQPTGPLYLPSESGFLRFNGTGSSTDPSGLTNTFGSYVNFKAPIGNTNTVTVEMWVRMRKATTTAGMLFGWRIYDVLTRADAFGFNTGNGDIYGISATQSLDMVNTWTHCVFEMRSDVSYTNNKMYINGNLQTLSAQVAPYGTGGGTEISGNRNFNGGVGKIGGWGLDNRYMFNGDISVFRVYNRALTKDEIMKNYSTEKKRYEILPVLMKNNLVTSINFDDTKSYFGDGTISGTASDLSGNNVNASLLIKSTTTVPVVRRTNTLYNGKELIFTGELETNPSLFWNTTTNITNFLAFTGISNTSISISFWVKLGARKTTDQELIVKWSDTAGFIGPWNIYQSIAQYAGSYINFRLWDGVSASSYITKKGNKRVYTDKWMHICATYNSTTEKMKTYIDSVIDIDSSAPYGYSLVNHLGNVYVGGRPPVSYTSGTGTWVCPQGVTSVIVECWGAGGGGGGGNSQGAGGGGGGGYAKNTITVTPGTTYYWSAGSGGAAGPSGAGAANGGAGGASWFNSANTAPTSIAGVMAGGGGGGISQTNGAGGAAGVGIYGATRYNGGSGANGLNTADNGGGGGGGAAGTIGNGYNGGSSLSSTTRGLAGLNGGNGGVGGGYLQSGANAGGNGTTPGGGGGGGFYFSTNNVGGGVGGSGKVSIYFDTEFKGSIANVQIYGKELTVGEIKNNYDADKFEFDNFNDASKFYSHELNGNPTFSIYENLILDVSGKSNDKILSSNSEGKASWVDKSYFFNRPINYRYIGELYGGGIIVAMWKYPSTVFNYLIMSLEDVSASTVWSNVTSTTASTTSEHNGVANTNGIIGQSSHTNSAAQLCKDYRGGGFSDWYLPSLTELNHGFNAGSVVDTVLGSDILKGTYWTSTEINSTKAYAYDFANTTVFIGSRVFGDALKTVTNKARAFRLAKVNERRRWWELWWERDYTPQWWGDGGSWWDEGNFRFTTTISIGIPNKSNWTEVAGGTTWNNTFSYQVVDRQASISFTFSNTISTNETILNNGVCWSTTSATPTISGSVSYSSGPSSYVVKTPSIYGATVGTIFDDYNQSHYPIIYFRAFVTTPSGVYYSSNSGKRFSGATYSTSPTAYAYWPSGCYIGGVTYYYSRH